MHFSNFPAKEIDETKWMFFVDVLQAENLKSKNF